VQHYTLVPSSCFDKLQQSKLLGRDKAEVFRFISIIIGSAAIHFNGLPSLQVLIGIILTPPGIPP
jgi:hypothetical protein